MISLCGNDNEPLLNMDMFIGSEAERENCLNIP